MYLSLTVVIVPLVFGEIRYSDMYKITSCVGCLVIVIIITGTTFGLFVCVVLRHKKKQVNLI